MNSFFDYGKQLVNGISDAIGYGAKAAASATGQVAKQALDTQVKATIDATSTAASKAVTQKIFDALYKEPSQYGVVRGSQQKVDIYNINSQVLNNVMKAATGTSIDEFIHSLPIGAKQAASVARKQLERVIARAIIEQLSALSIKPLTAQVLLKAYGYTEEQIAEYIKALGKEASSEVQDILKKNEQLTKAAQTESNDIDDFSVLTQTQIKKEGVSLLDVINYYKYKVQLNINEQIRIAIIEASALTAQMVAEAAVKNGIENANIAATTAAIASLATLGVGPAVVGLGVGQGLNHIKELAIALARTEAYQRVKQVTEHLLPSEILDINHEDAGQVEFETVHIDVDPEKYEFVNVDTAGNESENVVIEIDEREDWEFYQMNIMTPTFSRWVKDKYGVAAAKFHELLNDMQSYWAANRATSAIPEVHKHWLRDHDYPKLVAMKAAYVHAEKELNQLDYTLMSICEFAYGIRNDIDGTSFDNERQRGLEESLATLNALESKMQAIKNAADRVANNHLQVDNKKRRADLVNPANAALDKMIKQTKVYAEKVKEAVNEAQAMVKQEAKFC